MESEKPYNTRSQLRKQMNMPEIKPAVKTTSILKTPKPKPCRIPLQEVHLEENSDENEKSAYEKSAFRPFTKRVSFHKTFIQEFHAAEAVTVWTKTYEDTFKSSSDSSHTTGSSCLSASSRILSAGENTPCTIEETSTELSSSKFQKDNQINYKTKYFQGDDSSDWSHEMTDHYMPYSNEIDITESSYVLSKDNLMDEGNKLRFSGKEILANRDNEAVAWNVRDARLRIGRPDDSNTESTYDLCRINASNPSEKLGFYENDDMMCSDAVKEWTAMNDDSPRAIGNTNLNQNCVASLDLCNDMELTTTLKTSAYPESKEAWNFISNGYNHTEDTDSDIELTNICSYPHFHATDIEMPSFPEFALTHFKEVEINESIVQGTVDETENVKFVVDVLDSSNSIWSHENFVEVSDNKKRNKTLLNISELQTTNAVHHCHTSNANEYKMELTSNKSTNKELAMDFRAEDSQFSSADMKLLMNEEEKVKGNSVMSVEFGSENNYSTGSIESIQQINYETETPQYATDCNGLIQNISKFNPLEVSNSERIQSGGGKIGVSDVHFIHTVKLKEIVNSVNELQISDESLQHLINNSERKTEKTIISETKQNESSGPDGERDNVFVEKYLGHPTFKNGNITDGILKNGTDSSHKVVDLSETSKMNGFQQNRKVNNCANVLSAVDLNRDKINWQTPKYIKEGFNVPVVKDTQLVPVDEMKEMENIPADVAYSIETMPKTNKLSSEHLNAELNMSAKTKRIEPVQCSMNNNDVSKTEDSAIQPSIPNLVTKSTGGYLRQSSNESQSNSCMLNLHVMPVNSIKLANSLPLHCKELETFSPLRLSSNVKETNIPYTEQNKSSYLLTEENLIELLTSENRIVEDKVLQNVADNSPTVQDITEPPTSENCIVEDKVSSFENGIVKDKVLQDVDNSPTVLSIIVPTSENDIVEDKVLEHIADNNPIVQHIIELPISENGIAEDKVLQDVADNRLTVQRIIEPPTSENGIVEDKVLLDIADNRPTVQRIIEPPSSEIGIAEDKVLQDVADNRPTVQRIIEQPTSENVIVEDVKNKSLYIQHLHSDLNGSALVQLSEMAVKCDMHGNKIIINSNTLPNASPTTNKTIELEHEQISENLLETNNVMEVKGIEYLPPEKNKKREILSADVSASSEILQEIGKLSIGDFSNTKLKASPVREYSLNKKDICRAENLTVKSSILSSSISCSMEVSSRPDVEVVSPVDSCQENIPVNTTKLVDPVTVNFRKAESSSPLSDCGKGEKFHNYKKDAESLDVDNKSMSNIPELSSSNSESYLLQCVMLADKSIREMMSIDNHVNAITEDAQQELIDEGYLQSVSNNTEDVEKENLHHLLDTSPEADLIQTDNKLLSEENENYITNNACVIGTECDNIINSSIADQIKSLEVSSHGEWCIKEQSDTIWSFQFLYKSVELVIRLGTEVTEGESSYRDVTDVDFISYATEKADQLVKFVHKVLFQDLRKESLNVKCKSTKNVIEVLNIVLSQVKRFKMFIKDFIELEALELAKLQNNCVTFDVSKMEILAWFRVTVSLSHWDNIIASDVSVENLVGDTSEQQVKQLVTGAVRGPGCLKDYVRIIKKYVEIISKT